jgi:lysyl-tRNA synthetase class I
MRDWFEAVCGAPFGQDQGPCFGSFVLFVSCAETTTLSDRAPEDGFTTAAG